jgi:hypothetical protein
VTTRDALHQAMKKMLDDADSDAMKLDHLHYDNMEQRQAFNRLFFTQEVCVKLIRLGFIDPIGKLK